MGGRATRLINEIANDSMQIVHSTSRNVYEDNVHTKRDILNKLDTLKQAQSKAFEAKHKSKMMESLHTLQAQKQYLDGAVRIYNYMILKQVFTLEWKRLQILPTDSLYLTN